ncbi:MAG: IS200/IS605 family element transposase accessory protein TnpB [Methanosphaera sp.]|nr:IS200/IS605 family element transposase accessory protein TnpB [Methanosphaera sp.]
MECGEKFRIYPNDKQEVLINKTFGCCRLVWNYFLDGRDFEYEIENIIFNYYDCSKLLKTFKKHKTFLKEVDSTALQRELRNLDQSFKNFFNKVCGHPNFKSRKDNRQSYTSVKNGNNIRFENDGIRLPKLGIIRCSHKPRINGRILSVTVSRTKSMEYYVSVQYTDVEVPHIEPVMENQHIGLDVGIKNTVTTSTGQTYHLPKKIDDIQKKIEKLQRKLSRQQKDSNNYEKTRVKIAKQYEKIHNITDDFYHKLSNKIIRKEQIISIEHLNIQGMLKNHKLARRIQTQSWNSLFSKLKYKTQMYGKTLIKIDRFFPSTKQCHNCGYKNDELTLETRTWQCPQCKSIHDRDVNAAINISEEGFKIYNREINRGGSWG